MKKLSDMQKESYKRLNSLINQHFGVSIEDYMLMDYEKCHKRIKNGSYMDLVIERYSPESLIIGHYGEQNGDLMADPQLEIQVKSSSILPDHAQPLNYRNDYLGKFDFVYPEERKVDINQKISQTKFMDLWLNNLENQGFYKQEGK